MGGRWKKVTTTVISGSSPRWAHAGKGGSGTKLGCPLSRVTLNWGWALEYVEGGIAGRGGILWNIDRATLLG